MLRVPGVNFRNVLLCLAIVLQLLTFLKHTGSSIINLPDSLPIGSAVDASSTTSSEPSKRTHTRTAKSTKRDRAHGTPNSLISSVQSPVGLSLGSEGSPASSSPSSGHSGKSTLHSADPMESGGGSAGTPTVANPSPGRSAPAPINAGSSVPSFAKTEPPTDTGSSGFGGPESVERGSPPENGSADPGAGDAPELIIE